MKVYGNRLLVLPTGSGHDKDGNIVSVEDEENKNKIILPDTVEKDPRKQTNAFVVLGVGNGKDVENYFNGDLKEGDKVYLPNPLANRDFPVITLENKDYLIITPDQVIYVEESDSKILQK